MKGYRNNLQLTKEIINNNLQNINWNEIKWKSDSAFEFWFTRSLKKNKLMKQVWTEIMAPLEKM